MSLQIELGACSWSLQPQGIDGLLVDLSQLPVRSVQLHLDPLHRDAAAWPDTGAKLTDAGFRIASGMFTPIGEDYTTPATIRATGGVLPDQHWEANLAAAAKNAQIAAELGIGVVSFHAGFIPHGANDPKRQTVAERLCKIADTFCHIAGCVTLLETGQETAETLAAFLDELDHPHIGVNFDPANMLLYDMGDPIAALERLLPWVKQVHIKDATRPTEPGAWGSEVVVGTGEVDWPAFFGVLRDAGFAGDAMIEREAGDQRLADIAAAATHVLSVTQEPIA